MSSPLLSVILPNYNHSRYVGGALEAMLSQSVRPLEIIIVDDASTDDSVSVIETYCRRDSIVRLVRNSRNLGNVGSTAVALRECRGKYLFNAAADDVVAPGFFEKSLALLEKHPQAGLCCAWPSTLDARTGAISPNPVAWSDRACFLTPTELAARINRNIIPGHASIMRRAAFEEVGGYLEELRWHSDWFSTLAIGFRHGICFIPEPLSLMRVLPGSFSAAGRTDRTAQIEVLRQLLMRLFAPQHRDLLPRFQEGQVLAHFGVEAAYAAAELGWHENEDALALLAGMTWRECEELLQHARPEIRCLAAGVAPRLGRHAWKLLLTLSGALDDRDVATRNAALRAFDALRRQPAFFPSFFARILSHPAPRRLARLLRARGLQRTAESASVRCRTWGRGLKRDAAHQIAATKKRPVLSGTGQAE